MTKKKYHGGLKVFLLLLFIILLGMCSTCYAKTTLTDEEASYIYNYMFSNTYNNNIVGNSSKNLIQYTSTINSNNLYATENSVNFLNYFNNNNTLDFEDVRQLLFFKFWWGNDGGYICYTKVNNSIGNNYPFPYFKFEDYNSNAKKITLYFINSNDMVPVAHQFIGFQFHYLNSNFNFDSYYPNFSVTTNGLSLYISNINGWNINSSSYEILEALPGITMLSKTPLSVVYSNYDGLTYIEPRSFLYQTFYNPYIEPEEPSGDIGGSTGTITNSSGEVTGQIDLSGIENGIKDVKDTISGEAQAIRDNDDKNTEQVVNAINKANENYWGSGDDLTGEDQQEFLDDAINELIDNVSGEFSRNAVFSEMERGEDIFLDFFRNKEDASFYDLIISWDSISPLITMYGGSSVVSSSELISGDSINISALCRNNETLSTIQQYIRIIFNFGTLIALLWQIYNLILSTLGIDNPYLYEDAQITDVVNGDTGEVHSYYRTRRRIYKKR